MARKLEEIFARITAPRSDAQVREYTGSDGSSLVAYLSRRDSSRPPAAFLLCDSGIGA